MARTTSTAGQKTAARAEAKALPATPPASVNVFVAMEAFSVMYRGQLVSFAARTRYSVEPALMAIITSTDRDYVQES